MNTEQAKPENGFLEAPASWNTRYIIPSGYSCQITLRGDTGRDLLEKADLALSFLIDHEYLPEVGYRKNGNGDTQTCPIHHCDMKKHEKDGKIWFSHKANDGWCHGKQKKNGGNHE